MCCSIRNYLNNGILLCGLLVCLAGCRQEEVKRETVFPNEGEPCVLSLRLEAEEDVDTAIVLFFKQYGDTDSLVYREAVSGIKYLHSTPFYFTLPAGKYRATIYGNVTDNQIVTRPPYSRDSVFVYYGDGSQPGAVYFGTADLNIGVDTSSRLGMVLLSAMVQLTVLEVPAEVETIRVKLLNTSTGLIVAGGYLPEATDPPYSVELAGVSSDSSYQLHFTCFPLPAAKDRSTLVVDCYDAAGQVVYFGQSAPFLARPGEKALLTCSFNIRVRSASVGASTLPGEVCFKMP